MIRRWRRRNKHPRYRIGDVAYFAGVKHALILISDNEGIVTLSYRPYDEWRKAQRLP